MQTIKSKPLNAKDFAPFGDVIEMPTAAGRTYFQDSLANLRPQASVSLSTIFKEPTNDLPIEVKLLERHEFSSQSFLPAHVKSWLIVVAPHAKDGKPDLNLIQAFLANGDQGVTYKPNTWHHGLTVFEEPAKFNVLMWRDNTSGDEEFVPVAPFVVHKF
ncbi:MAG: ureidoglycolate lyase [Alcaligenaceae bacterium]|nr:MAG: ureidoglycolate lyase [Alcaligenaceae bacterium]